MEEKLLELFNEVKNDISTMKTDIAVVKTKIQSMPNSFSCVTHTQTFEDHEERLRTLESFKNRFYGAIFLGNLITGIIVSIVVAILARS